MYKFLVGSRKPIKTHSIKFIPLREKFKIQAKKKKLKEIQKEKENLTIKQKLKNMKKMGLNFNIFKIVNGSVMNDEMLIKRVDMSHKKLQKSVELGRELVQKIDSDALKKEHGFNYDVKFLSKKSKLKKYQRYGNISNNGKYVKKQDEKPEEEEVNADLKKE